MTPNWRPQVPVQALVVHCQLQADFLGFCLILVKKWPIYLKRHRRRNNCSIPKFQNPDKTARCWERVYKILAKKIRVCESYLKSKLGPLSWPTLYNRCRVPKMPPIDRRGRCGIVADEIRWRNQLLPVRWEEKCGWLSVSFIFNSKSYFVNRYNGK